MLLVSEGVPLAVVVAEVVGVREEEGVRAEEGVPVAVGEALLLAVAVDVETLEGEGVGEGVG